LGIARPAARRDLPGSHTRGSTGRAGARPGSVVLSTDILEVVRSNPDFRQSLVDSIENVELPAQYVPVMPTPKQWLFLMQDRLEVFFGGAAGPGKSWGLLMAALQYVEHPGYHALLLRPSLTEFEQQGGLIELGHMWLGRTDAHWHGGKRQWQFPSGATVRFGYLRNEADLSHYPGGGVSFLGFDELTLFTERLYLGMFRLLRQAVDKLEGVPLRVRSASNPGNVGHGWVKGRFIEDETKEPDALYVKATIADNPYLDYDTYVNQVLVHMHPVDRERLIRGDWDVMEEGGKFKRHDFELVDASPLPRPQALVRYWDLAGTEPSPSSPDPDFTVGVLYSLDEDDRFTIRDVNMFRLNDDEVEEEVKNQAALDADMYGGAGAVPIYIEQDPGQAGKAQLTNYVRRVLRGYVVRAGSTRMRGRHEAKAVRAAPAAAAVGNHLVRLVRGRNHRDFLSQCAMFPQEGIHDDCVDAFSGAHNAITGSGNIGHTTVQKPRGEIPGVSPPRFTGRDMPQPRGIPVGPTPAHLRRTP